MSLIEKMNDLLGSNYQIVSQNGEPIVLSNANLSERVSGNSYSSSNALTNDNESSPLNAPMRLNAQRPGLAPKSAERQGDGQKKTVDDYVFQLYLGSLTVVGLFVLFRMIQKSR